MNQSIKELVSNLIDENSSKDMIEKVAVISNKLDELKAESDKKDTEYKDLLKEYSHLIKTSLYKPDNSLPNDNIESTPVSVESFFKQWEKENLK